MHSCAQTLWVKQNSSAICPLHHASLFSKEPQTMKPTEPVYVSQQWTPWPKAAVSAVGGTAEEETRIRKELFHDVLIHCNHKHYWIWLKLVPLRCQSRIGLWEWCNRGIIEEDGVKPLVIFTFRHVERFVVWQEGEMFLVLEALVMSRIWAPEGNNHLWLWMPLMRFQRLTSAGDWHCSLCNSSRVLCKVVFLVTFPKV